MKGPGQEISSVTDAETDLTDGKYRLVTDVTDRKPDMVRCAIMNGAQPFAR